MSSDNLSKIKNNRDLSADSIVPMETPVENNGEVITVCRTEYLRGKDIGLSLHRKYLSKCKASQTTIPIKDNYLLSIYEKTYQKYRFGPNDWRFKLYGRLLSYGQQVAPIENYYKIKQIEQTYESEYLPKVNDYYNYYESDSARTQNGFSVILYNQSKCYRVKWWHYNRKCIEQLWVKVIDSSSLNVNSENGKIDWEFDDMLVKTVYDKHEKIEFQQIHALSGVDNTDKFMVCYHV